MIWVLFLNYSLSFYRPINTEAACMVKEFQTKKELITWLNSSPVIPSSCTLEDATAYEVTKKLETVFKYKEETVTQRVIDRIELK